GFSRFFADSLQQDTPLISKEAEDGEILRWGHLYIAPCGLQTEVKALGQELQLRVYKPSESHVFNPSVDVLFHSVSKHVGAHAIGILLTGMGEDGAQGLKSMLEAGAHTIGQDEQSSVVYGMPGAARRIGGVQTELPLKAIAKQVLKMVGRPA
ncbi:MAG: CheB methylesterase domain-containing protein, partial [Pseudobdellovibrionaceae bacterium]|nr:CheB methylesterase domain-containing protein [Pseudobdellovibrionaceae bacterium]